jgi:triosephosphate isomerase (TIM)
MKKLILANFKSNKSVDETELWFKDFLKSWKVGGRDAEKYSNIDISVSPQALSLFRLSEMLDGNSKNTANLSLAIQDISSFPAGSYTGAVSGQNLSGLRIKYSIVGHSERRKYFGETSHDVALKVEQALANDITPVLCVDTEYLDEQFGLISKEDLAKCVVAYEPISAIGSGNNADVGMVREVVEKVKRLAGDVRVLYGGSVDEFNVNEYFLVTDGVLIGGASLNVEQFIKVLEAVSN